MTASRDAVLRDHARIVDNLSRNALASEDKTFKIGLYSKGVDNL